MSRTDTDETSHVRLSEAFRLRLLADEAREDALNYRGSDLGREMRLVQRAEDLERAAQDARVKMMMRAAAIPRHTDTTQHRE